MGSIPAGGTKIIVDKTKKRLYNNNMKKIKVIWKDTSGVASEREFDNLTPAMDWAKTLAVFVTIKSNEYEIVGKFGVDTIKDGVCPDGVAYDWKKRRK
ncbi:MAG: hypothetical protein WCH77_14680 [Planctomycetota bacterium]